MTAKSARNGFSYRFVERLQLAGIRATRQRLALAGLLLDGTNKHVSAEQLHQSVNKNNIKVSLATVYNCLNQFAEAGLIKEISVNKGCAHFDTNTQAHHHFFDETEKKLTDIPLAAIEVKKLPRPPAHQKIVGVEIIVRTKTSA